MEICLEGNRPHSLWEECMAVAYVALEECGNATEDDLSHLYDEICGGISNANELFERARIRLHGLPKLTEAKT